jgi:cytochrome c-type biogenesis protein CcmH/NrfG
VDDFGLAERFLIRAVELDPLRARTQYHLGLLRLSQGDTATATLALQTAVRLDPEGQVGDLALRTLQRFLPPPP